MRFPGSKFTQNALAAGAPPRTPMGELKRSPEPLPISGGKEGKEEGRKWQTRYWGRERGREGKRGGMERGRRWESEGRGILRHWR